MDSSVRSSRIRARPSRFLPMRYLHPPISPGHRPRSIRWMRDSRREYRRWIRGSPVRSQSGRNTPCSEAEERRSAGTRSTPSAWRSSKAAWPPTLCWTSSTGRYLLTGPTTEPVRPTGATWSWVSTRRLRQNSPRSRWCRRSARAPSRPSCWFRHGLAHPELGSYPVAIQPGSPGTRDAGRLKGAARVLLTCRGGDGTA